LSRREKILLALLGTAGVLYLFSLTSGGQMLTGGIADKIGKLITGAEGEKLTVYKDSGGAWTIGKGHLVKPGEKFFPYGGSMSVTNTGVKTITKAQSDALFTADTKIAHDAVSSAVKVPLSDNQFAALVSLVFNIGAGAFAESTLLRKLNARDYTGAAAEFNRWVYDEGVTVPGLVSRRLREQAVFNA
jgi:lysozyme